jgi:hypothetical protein
MNALLLFRWVGYIFRFAIFLRYGEQLLNLNGTELLASARNPVCDGDIIARVGEQQ